MNETHLANGSVERSCVAADSLRQLSNDQLMHAVHGIVTESRKLTARLVVFLVEVDRRRLWELLACTSLNDFCRRRLRMSDDAAHRRATAARLAGRFPIILEK